MGDPDGIEDGGGATVWEYRLISADENNPQIWRDYMPEVPDFCAKRVGPELAR
jgi:hypothetical protein